MCVFILLYTSTQNLHICITPEKYIDYVNIVPKNICNTLYVCRYIYFSPKQIFPCFELCLGAQSPFSSSPTGGLGGTGTANQGSWVFWRVNYSSCCTCPALAVQGSLPWLVLHFWILFFYGSITEIFSLALQQSVFLQQPGGTSSFWNVGTAGSVPWIGERWCLIKGFEGSQECSDQQLRSSACKIIQF